MTLEEKEIGARFQVKSRVDDPFLSKLRSADPTSPL